MTPTRKEIPTTISVPNVKFPGLIPIKKALTNYFASASFSSVGVEGFEPPTLCL